MKKQEIFFLVGLLLNSFGNSFYFIALPMMVYHLTKSAGAMGVMGVITALPILFCMPFIGSVVDRLSKRKLLLFSTFLQAVLVLGIASVSWFQWGIYWVYFLGAVVAMNVEIFKVTLFATVPLLFSNLEKGNAKISSIHSMSELLAPFVASVIIATFQIEMVFVVNFVTAFSFFFLLLLSLRVEEKETREEIRYSLIKESMEALRAVKNSGFLKSLILIIALSNLGDAGLLQLLIYRMASDFQLSEPFIFLLIGLSSIGAFLGTFLPFLAKKSSVGQRLFFGLMLNNIGIFLLLGTSWQFILVALFVCNFGGMVYSIAQSTMIQVLSDEKMLGRMNATVRLLMQISRPISLAILMFLAHRFGAYSGILFSVGFTICTTVLLIRSNLSRMEAGR